MGVSASFLGNCVSRHQSASDSGELPLISIEEQCESLAQVPGLDVSLPSSLAYNATEAAYWSMLESNLAPSCIVSPHTTSEVSATVSILVRDRCLFAIKGQGHSPAAGFANIDHGVTIDMTGIKAVSVDQTTSIAHVGAGASWLDVYTYLDQYNRTVAGGRNGAVGVAGLTTGGGISYFSPQVGFACDTLVNVELVLCDGRITNVNATSHSDLFRALKGGAGNFGIVTRLDFASIEYRGLLGGSVGYNISQRKQVFQAFTDIAGARAYDVHASIVVGLLFNGTAKTWALSSTPAYTEPVSRPVVYEELFSIPNISDTLQVTTLGKLANEEPTPPLNWLFETLTFGVSADLLDSIFESTSRTLQAFDPPGTTLWDLAIEPLPTVFVSRGSGHNSLGTSPADGDSIVMLISAFWTDPDATEPMQSKAAEIVSQIREAASAAGQSRRFVYANYAGPYQQPLQSYGRDNVDFLKQVSKKYDPEGAFQKLVPGGFKL